MGLLDRLEELDRRAGVHGAGPRPTTPAGWALLAVLGGAGVAVVVAAGIADGAAGVLRAVVPVVVVALLLHSPIGRDRRRLQRWTVAVLVVAVLLTLPAAVLGFWQGTAFVVAMGAGTLGALHLADRRAG